MKHHAIGRFAASLIAAVTMLSCIASAAAITLRNPRCEYRANPLGIDAPKPRLSWIIGDPESETSSLKSQIPRAQMQSAYQVLVASTPELLAKDQGDPGGQRQGGIGPEHPGGICRQAVRIHHLLPLESAGVA